MFAITIVIVILFLLGCLISKGFSSLDEKARLRKLGKLINGRWYSDLHNQEYFIEIGKRIITANSEWKYDKENKLYKCGGEYLLAYESKGCAFVQGADRSAGGANTYNRHTLSKTPYESPCDIMQWSKKNRERRELLKATLQQLNDERRAEMDRQREKDLNVAKAKIARKY